MLRFSGYRFAVEREPLLRPFHFKGGYFTEKWINVITLLTDEGPASGGAGATGTTAIGGNAVLWSDSGVFNAFSESGGNMLMAVMAERACQMIRGQSFPTPLNALDQILPELHTFGQTVTGRNDLSPTFTLNTLVALDLALWKVYARQQASTRLGALIPENYRPALSARQTRLARIPLITYNTPTEEVVRLVDEGHFFLKIKIGQAGDQQEMLSKDKDRLETVHDALRNRADREKLCFYLDANGRYECKETVQALLEHLDRTGLLDQVVLLEEPFPYPVREEVSDLPVRIAADESLHSMADLQERLDQGYGAVALKPAGKTLSLSVQMAAAAVGRGIPCFVADSACVPLLLEWNKAFAALLPGFPDLSMGVIESNGDQNYRNWQRLLEDHPMSGSPWISPQRGVFELDGAFHALSGGIFGSAGHYETLV